MITPDKTFTIEVTEDQIYKGFAQQPDDIQTCLQNNGFVMMAKTQKQQTGQTALYFSAKTVNNLPLLFEVAHPHNGNDKSVVVTYKVPVMPLKPLIEDALKFIFYERN